MPHHCGGCEGVFDNICWNREHMIECPLHPNCYTMPGARCKTCIAIEETEARRAVWERQERESEESERSWGRTEKKEKKLSKAKQAKAKRNEAKKNQERLGKDYNLYKKRQ
ncbi:hypothetical protein BJY04DRAFT_213686 [Aspergillus karnatakaensis]|uniref:uncharacterized protein n=1 Tax=Aspergillus karnatakaensis TaxID=1810916 RepID=UPI003CCD335B